MLVGVGIVAVVLARFGLSVWGVSSLSLESGFDIRSSGVLWVCFLLVGPRAGLFRQVCGRVRAVTSDLGT